MAIYIGGAEAAVTKLSSCTVIGPQGEKGEKGDKGDPGPQGPAGGVVSVNGQTGVVTLSVPTTVADLADGSTVVRTVNNQEPDNAGDVALYTFSKALCVYPSLNEDHALELHSFANQASTKVIRIGVSQGAKLFFEDLQADESNPDRLTELTNLLTPTNACSAATKGYVDEALTAAIGNAIGGAY